MPLPAPVARVHARLTQGEGIAAACQAERVTYQQDLTVDAHYNGKPVCTVTLPWVIDGHAFLWADETLVESIAEARLQAMASALAMPVCIVRREVAPRPQS